MRFEGKMALPEKVESKAIIGKPLVLDDGSQVGIITDVDIEKSLIFGEIFDEKVGDVIVNNLINSISMEVVKQ